MGEPDACAGLLRLDPFLAGAYAWGADVAVETDGMTDVAEPREADREGVGQAAISAPARPEQTARSAVPERDSGPFPLVLGVTGHRDLRAEDVPRLQERIAGLLTMLKRRYPHTPFVLLSPLAEGADRLVAEVALAQGCRLIAPLPMPAEEFERDFPEEASQKEFRDLLQRADHSFTLALLSPLEAIQAGGEARDRQYEQVGAYVATHSQILIALWDGVETNLMGGTSRIVRFQLDGVPPPYAPPRSPLDQVETGLVVHIVTPRRKNPVPAETPFAVRLLLPQNMQDDDDGEGRESRRAEPGENVEGELPELPGRYHRIFARLDLCNRDAVELGPRLESIRAATRRYLPAPGEIGSEAPEFERNVRAFVVVDALALHFARATRRALWALALLGLIAVAGLDLFHAFRVQQFVYLYAGALLVAVAAWLWLVKRRDVQDRYLDYRALAEGLRVQSFWHLAGIGDCVAGHYLRKQKSELDWIRNAIRVAEIPRAPQPAGRSPAGDLSRYALVLRYWIEDQGHWYHKRTMRDRERMRRSRWGVWILLATGLALAALAALAIAAASPAGDTLVLLSTIPLAFAGLWEGVADKMAYADQYRQYHRMHQVFERAVAAMKDALERRDHDEAESIIKELGTEALAENGDWVVLHRARPLEVPKA